MSIIYEALKKAEANTTSTNSVKTNKLVPGVNSGNLPQRRRISPVFYALIALCAVPTVLIAIGAYLFNQDPRQQIIKSYLDKQAGEKNKAFYPAIPVTAEGKTAITKSGKTIAATDNLLLNTHNSSTYSLQGIIYDKDLPFAIINGKTLRKSESIDDFVVIDIAPTIVTLKNSKSDKELTLSF